MPLITARGNMYSWVTHMHAHLGGECPHKCSYCYVDSPRFGRPKKFTGKLRMMVEEFEVKYGAGRTIFVDHCNDLWAEPIPDSWIMLALNHCAVFPDNTYVFQTKNPARFAALLDWMPPKTILGCTIETNRTIDGSISFAPNPYLRARAMKFLRKQPGERKLFVTIEPIMDFDVSGLGGWLMEIRPDFVNIGADSKGHGLPEPTAAKVLVLLDVLRAAGIEVRQKANLDRLMRT